MCLDRITTPRKLKSDGTGYKVFYKTHAGSLYFRFFKLKIGRKDRLPRGVWMKEEDYRYHGDKGRNTMGAWSVKYPMGFHVYLNKKQTKTHVCYPDVIIPVKFRKAHTKGRQGGQNVIVAKEIFIPKEG